MAVIKCKSCGNEVTLPENVVQGYCIYCGGPVAHETPAAKPEDKVEVNTQLHRGRKKTIIMVSIIVTVVIAIIAAVITTIVYVINDRQEVTKSVDDVCIVENGVVTGVRGDKEKITNVVIPDGVTEIGDAAFSGCSSLTSVTIPNSVISIGVKAFSGCSSLKEVIVPEKCKIADNAFPQECLVIKLPAELITKIIQGDADALAKLDELRSTLQGFEFSADFTVVTGVKNKNITTATIPASVTEIGGWAFAGCTSLTSVTIPNSVTSIGKEAFAGCTSLTSVTIPNSVTSIGNAAFAGCTSLKEVIVPEKCKIADNAFPQECLVIKLPAELVTKIRQGDADAPAILDEWRLALQQGIEFSDGCKTVTGVKKKYITKVTIPYGVTEIGEYAFLDRHSLRSVTIPNSVTKIGGRAFSGCSSLKEVRVPYDCSVANGAFPDGCRVIRY